jgi:putative ABC transport system permease protein
VSESVALAFGGGVLGVVVARFVLAAVTKRFIGLGIPLNMKVNAITAALALLIAVILGVVSGYLPAYKASRINIVEGLRHIG